MRNFLCTLICLIYCYTLCIASSIDSLKLKLSISDSPIQKSTILNTIANCFVKSGEADSILHYSQLATLELKPSSQSETMMDAKLLVGIGHLKNGDFNDAMEIFQFCKTIAEKRNYGNLLIQSINNIAVIHFEQGNYNKAIEIWKKQNEAHTENKDQKSTFKSKHNNIGLAYRLRGDYDKAIDYFLKGRAISESTNDTSMLIRSYNNLGLIYKQFGDSLKALESFEKTEQLSVLFGNKRLEAMAQINLGTLYLDKGANVKALAYFESGLEKKKKLNDKKGTANALTNIASLYFQLNDLDKSQLALDQSMKLLIEMNSRLKITTLNLLQSKIYSKQGKYEEAIEILETTKSKFGEINSTFKLNNILLELSKCYAKIGQFDKAQNELDNYSKLIVKAEKTNGLKKLAHMKNAIELEKAKRSIAEYKSQVGVIKADKKFWKMLVFMSFLAISLLGYALRNKYKLSQLMKSDNEILISQNSKLNNQSNDLKLTNKTLEAELHSTNEKLKEPDFVKEGTITLFNRQKTVLKLGDIIYIKASQNGVQIVTTTEKFIYWKGIGKFLLDLPPTLFVKTHRSFIVNKTHVKAIRSEFLLMSNGDSIRIGGYYKRAATSKISNSE